MLSAVMRLCRVVGHNMLVNLLKAEYQTRVTIGSQYNKFLSGTEQYNILLCTRFIQYLYNIYIINIKYTLFSLANVVYK